MPLQGKKKELLCVLPKKQKHSQGKLKLCHIADGKPLSGNFTRRFAKDCTPLTGFLVKAILTLKL